MAARDVQLRSATLGLARAFGVDVGRVLELAAVSRSQFASAKAGVVLESQAMKARLTTREYFALWSAVEQVGAAPDIGLRVGAEKPALIDALMAGVHAPNLRTALKKFARYKPVCCAELVQVDVDQETRISLHWLYTDENVPTTCVDATLAATLALARQGTAKPLRPLRVELTRRFADEAILKRHFTCDVCFDAPADSLVFDQRAVTQPFVTQNDLLSAMMLPVLEAGLQAEQERHSVADDVKYVLRRLMFGQRPSVEQVASEMHMGHRTLQRRLTALGTSYQNLLDQERNRAARCLLLDTNLTAGDIALLLGFNETNSFIRAFRAWEGSPPSRWREDRITVDRATVA